MTRQIDQPLGQTRPAQRRRPRLRALLGGAGGLAVAAIAVVVALQRDPVRVPVEPVAAPEATAPPATTPAAGEAPATPQVIRPNAEDAAPGPSIITVDPPQNGDGVIVIRDPSSLQQNPRTAHLPDRALIEQTEYGPLPKRGPDGRRPVDVYARPWSGARGARVALVIGGLGLSQTGTQDAIRLLPDEVTLAFAPSGNSLQRWMQAARQQGHEIVMQVPLEPFDFPRVNPGRNTLTVAASTADNIAHLRWALGRTTNYTGVMNYMGARFTAEPAALGPVMEELGRRGLAYFDDGSSARSQAAALARQYRVPFAAADAAIDGAQDRAAILARLDELERIARAKGTAIGTGAAFEVTVATVVEWCAEARKRGIEIVPVSALLDDTERKQ